LILEVSEETTKILNFSENFEEVSLLGKTYYLVPKKS